MDDNGIAPYLFEIVADIFERAAHQHTGSGRLRERPTIRILKEPTCTRAPATVSVCAVCVQPARITKHVLRTGFLRVIFLQFSIQRLSSNAQDLSRAGSI